MNIKRRQLISFAGIIVAVTLLVFPSDYRMVNLYIQSNMLEEAKSTLAPLLKKSPRNINMLNYAAQIALLEGDPFEAIHNFETIRSLKPRHIPTLKSLLHVYQAIGQSDHAIMMLQLLNQAIPQDVNLLRELINYYNYKSLTQKEYYAILKLIAIEASVHPEQTPVVTLLTDILIEFIQHQTLNHDSPYDRALVCQIYWLRETARHSPHPGNFTPLKRAIEELVAFGHSRKAIAYLEKFFEITNTRSNELHDWIHILALGTTDQQLLQNAAKWMEQFGLDTPEQLQHQALLYERLQQNEKAFSIYRKQVEIEPLNKTAILRLLNFAGSTADAVLVENGIETALNAMPDDSEICLKSIELYLWVHTPQKAYHFAKRLTLRNPGLDLVNKLLEIAPMTDSHQLQKDAVDIAMRLFPDAKAILEAVDKSNMRLNQSSESIALYQRYLQKHPEDREMKKRLGELYLANNDVTHAYRIFHELHQIDPANPGILIQYVQVARWIGKVNDTVEPLENGLAKHPENDDIRELLADALCDTNRIEDGIRHLEHIVKKTPRQSDLRRKLAKAYTRIESWEAVIDLLAPPADITGPETWTPADAQLLAQAYLAVKNGPKALKQLAYIAPDQPATPQEGLMLAMAWEYCKQPESAAKIYNRLAQMHPSDTHLLNHIGEQLLHFQHSREASFYFLKVLKLDTDNLTALNGIGQTYVQNQNLRAASNYFERYLRLNPGDSDIRYQLTDIYLILGRKNDALKQYRELKKQHDKVAMP